MSSKNLYITIAVIVVLLLILIFAYEKGWLNKFLPTSWQKSGFVGAYGRTPGMQNCLAYPGPNQRWSNFNRCTWV